MLSEEDTQLIARAKDGQTDAVNEVFERVGPRLHALVRLRLGPQLRGHIESVDIVQQTLLKAFQNLQGFEGQAETSLMAWLGAIAKNEIVDQARYLGRDRRDATKNVAVDDVGELVASQVRSEVSRLHLDAQTKRLETALEGLSEAHREVILLRRYEEFSFTEIGERMNKSPDACRMLYARAMAALTVSMQALTDGD